MPVDASGSPVSAAALNIAWVVAAGCLVFFLQAGFALLATGLTRAKNVAHTMCMNVLIFLVGALGFWVGGFALMFGNLDGLPTLAGSTNLASEITLPLFGNDFGLFGNQGFFLAGRTSQAGYLAFFLFQLMCATTAAAIPAGALAERWRFSSFLLFGIFTSMVLYPVYGNWVWSSGWLAQLGATCGLGHGHVDFAGASVIHMVGGVTALAGARALGPRIGKFKPNGAPNPMLAHSVPQYLTGTLVLAFGWFGLHAGNTLAAADPALARVAVNTALALAAGGLAATCFSCFVYQKPDPSFLCNGILAGLVSVSAGCAYVTPWAAVMIGVVAGVLVVGSSLFVERTLRIDDPVGAISVHGVTGGWGVLAVGLFADGTYAPRADFNGVAGNVTGLFYGDASQFAAQCVGLLANVIWVFPVATGFFWLLNHYVGNRVSAPVEFQGLDIPEMGALGYVLPDADGQESRTLLLLSREPEPALAPRDGSKRFSARIEGIDQDLLSRTWSDLCQAGLSPPSSEFRTVYPYMTTLQGNLFRFRGGDPQRICVNLEQLLRQRTLTHLRVLLVE